MSSMIAYFLYMFDDLLEFLACDRGPGGRSTVVHSFESIVGGYVIAMTRVRPGVVGGGRLGVGFFDAFMASSSLFRDMDRKVCVRSLKRWKSVRRRKRREIVLDFSIPTSTPSFTGIFKFR
jgi:hypothetical protein